MTRSIFENVKPSSCIGKSCMRGIKQKIFIKTEEVGNTARKQLWCKICAFYFKSYLFFIWFGWKSLILEELLFKNKAFLFLLIYCNTLTTYLWWKILIFCSIKKNLYQYSHKSILHCMPLPRFYFNLTKIFFYTFKLKFFVCEFT